MVPVSDAQDAPTATGPDPIPNLSPHQPFPILIRAHNGKSKERRASKVRLSTVLDPKDVDAFYARYAEVCKSGMTALKPRDRSRKKAKAKKKKGGVAA
jgi:signal recognition particle subunit SRP14